MKPWAIWLGSATLLILTLALISGLALYKYSQLQAAMNMPQPPEQPISIMAVAAKEISIRPSTTMIGTVLSPRSIILSNEIAGTVATIHFEPGQVVKENQVLVELDTSVERAQLDAAKARKQIAESAYKRIREAAVTRAVTPSDLDEATAQRAQAAAQVEELDAVINRKTLKAPFHGKIGLADTHEGQFLPSGFNIASLQGIEDYKFVDFMIPQSASESVKVGDVVQLQVQSHRLAGEVIALDSQADRKSRNLMARAKVTSELEYLTPGDSVKVLIEYGERITCVAVPAEALRSAPMQTYVYVVEPDKAGALRAYSRQVVPGPAVDGWISIVSGLEVGSQVASAGSFKLRVTDDESYKRQEGALVSIIPDSPKSKISTEVEPLPNVEIVP
ncbi:MAG: efflux RND transporter periplasmic adaptor subunit, partial [Aureliella sp.]